MDAEERARRAEAESAHQRERIQDIAAEADEEIAMLRQRILELEAEQQQVHKNGGDQALVKRARPKQRRTSYVQRFGQDFGGNEGGGDGELETTSKRSVDATTPQVDAGQLLLAMRHLVKLSKDIIDVTEPGDYADELS